MVSSESFPCFSIGAHLAPWFATELKLLLTPSAPFLSKIWHSSPTVSSSAFFVGCFRSTYWLVRVLADKSTTMNFMKNMANSAAEGMAKAADAVSTAAGEKELQAKIWNDDRKITSLKGEWGVAAYDAFVAKSDTLNAITDNYTAQINGDSTHWCNFSVIMWFDMECSSARSS